MKRPNAPALLITVATLAGADSSALGQPNSQWNVLAYGGKGEMHGEPICHALAYFSKSPLPLDLDSDFFGEKPADLETQAKVTLLGTMTGHKVYEVKQKVRRRDTAHPGPLDASLSPTMKILLIERRPGEFCDIYQNQYAYDTTNETDEAAILNIHGRQVLKTYETDSHTWFLAYWAMDGGGPLLLDADALYTAIHSASPVGAQEFKGAFNLSGPRFTTDVYSTDWDEMPLGRVDLELGVEGDKIIAISKRWIPARAQ